MEEQQIGDTNQQADSDEEQQDDILFPKEDNLADIHVQLVESDPYTRRHMAQSILKGHTEHQNKSSSTHHQQQSGYSDDPDGNDYASGANRDNDSHTVGTVQQNLPYINKLQEIFNKVEAQYKASLEQDSVIQSDNEATYRHGQTLHNLFNIFKSLLSLNERDLLEVLISDNYWRTTFGVLEYDPDIFNQSSSVMGRDHHNEDRGDLSPS